jgi:type IV pilus assembly protein PilC
LKQVIRHYSYKAVSADGKRTCGSLPAFNREEVFNHLTTRNLHILELKEQTYRSYLESDLLFNTLGKIGYRPYKSRDLMIFCRQLATMLQAGITLLHALRMLAGRFENSAVRNKIVSVLHSIEQGSTFHEALRRQNEFFPGLLIGMVETGETAGALDTIMERLAEHYEKQHDLDEKLRAATAYPLFICGTALAVISIMILFVLPQFAGIFNSLGVEMPFLSRLLLRSGLLASRYWFLVPLTAVTAIIAFRQTVKTDQGRLKADQLKLRLPLFGPLNTQIAAARFARSLGTLLSSGVNLYNALQLAGRVVNNRAIAHSISELGAALSRGETIADPMDEMRHFPALLVEMIRVGETSGTLDYTLDKTALFYEREVAYRVDRLGSVLEPALLLIVGIFIGLIVYAVLSPMYRIFEMI